jgi:transcriptional regulator with XRE-family HTH domain
MLGDRISNLREKKGLTQAELARAAGISQPSISQIEAGTRVPSLRVLLSISRGLGIPVSHLMGSETSELTEIERKYLHSYRKLDSRSKEDVLKFIERKLSS